MRPKFPSYRAARNVGGRLYRAAVELTFAGPLLGWKTRRREVGPSFDLSWKRTFLRAARRLGLSVPGITATPSMSAFPAGDLQVVAQPCARYLFNHRDSKLKVACLAELVVSSGGPQGPVVFEAPVYKTGDLPSHSYTELPSPREHLDGYVLWRIGEADWGDGKALAEPIKIGERRLWGGASFSEAHVQREVQHLYTEPSRSAVVES